MKQRNQIDNNLLREAGVELMKKNKMPLGNITRGNSMIGLTPCNKSVRIRTCNNHRLIITANQPDPNASLDIEGTYWLLMVMPERVENIWQSYRLSNSNCGNQGENDNES